MTLQRNSTRPLDAIAALLGVLVLNGTCADIVYQEADGIVVGEAELYSSRTHDGAGNGWRVVPDEDAGAGTVTNARGAYVQSLPDNNSAGGPLNPPEIRYRMQIFTPGTYRLYLRWEGNYAVNNGANSDSIFVDVVELKDGTVGAFGSSTNAIADWYEFTGGVDSDFATNPWRNWCEPEVNQAGASGYHADWFIPEVGVYTLRVTQREDGSAVDAFVFQLSSLPAPTDDGPPMSSLKQTRIAFNAAGDTYLRRGDGTNSLHGAETTMLLKNDQHPTPAGYDRDIYLRFDIDDLHALQGAVATNAGLRIHLLNEGIGTNHDIHVAVIAEDAVAERFDELALAPSIDPPSSNDVWSAANDEAVDFSKIYGGAPVGSFEISSSNENTTVGFTSPELLRAVRADTDGVLSMVLYRTMDSINTDAFASKEHASRPPPILDIHLQATRPGTVLLVQ